VEEANEGKAALLSFSLDDCDSYQVLSEEAASAGTAVFVATHWVHVITLRGRCSCAQPPSLRNFLSNGDEEDEHRNAEHKLLCAVSANMVLIVS